MSELLWRHLTSARWFGGKGRPARLVSITPLPWLSSPGSWPAVRMEIAEVEFDDSDSAAEFYQLALSYRPPDQFERQAVLGPVDHPELGSVIAHDASRDPGAMKLILSAMIDSITADCSTGAIQCRLLTADGLSADLEPGVFTGQQSNTSVMFADVAMLKLFRRLEIGRNLDIEVHQVLGAEETSEAARLFGWLEGSWRPAGSSTVQHADLGMLVEQLHDARDGWAEALGACHDGVDFSGPAAELGRALRHVHQALRRSFDSRTVDGSPAATIMSDRLDAAIRIAAELEPYRPALRDCFEALAGTQLAVQRLHGDFHLGQTLHTPTGWKIIDFEGEPAKTLAERSEPDSVFRDVAGMLRSFDYAAANQPSGHAEHWAQDCRGAFLTGYGGALDRHSTDILRAYEADKAIYEVVYETRNRPDWVPIPLAAIARLVAAPDPVDQHEES